MAKNHPEIEVVDRTTRSIRYLEHGWPTDLCRWHAHDEYELHLIVATRGKAFVGDYIGDFGPGMLFLTGPNLPHNWITDKVWTQHVDVRDMLIQFSQASVDSLVHGFPEFGEISDMMDLATSGILFTGFDADYARRQMKTIRDSAGPERIMAFIQYLVRLSKHNNKQTLSVAKLAKIAGGKKETRIGEVVDHIVQNFSEDFSVEAAAKMAGMSAASFSRNFQKETGKRFTEFVNRVRIGQACGLLYASDEQITSICYSVGFQNLTNFNRHFLKMKGMTPSEYRDTARRELLQTPERAE